MRRIQVHSGRLAMRRSPGLCRSQRRDWMRRMHRLLLAVRLCLQHEDREETYPGEEHNLEVAVALRREEVHVGQPHLRRGDGLSMGPGRTILL